MDEITIYDIAQKAGVSAATVSRVINNYPYVKKATRAKVLKLLEEMNYIPNDTARSLVNKSSKMVGILIADVRTTHHTEGVYYIEHEFSKRGYSCLIYNTGANPENHDSYIQMLSKKKIDAVVMMGSVYQNDAVKKAIESYIPTTPVAICNGFIDSPNVYGVVSDEKLGVMECVKLLSSKGHKNMAFILNHETPSNLEKKKGFELGVSEYVKDGSSYTILSGDSVEEIEKATSSLLEKHPNIDCIIYAEDFMALVGIHTLSEMKKRIPAEVAVMGINNSRYAEISVPALTSLDNMLYDTSLTAVRNLLQVMEGEHVNKKMLICSRIVEREST